MRLLKTCLFSFLLGVATIACAANTEKKSVADTESGKVQHIGYAEFNQKIADVTKDWKYIGDKPCIIDFYATWCGPCRMISPYLDDLAQEFKDDIYIYKIDVDKDRELGRMFGATSIPLLIFVSKDGSAQMSRGAMSKAELRHAINNVLLQKGK